MEEKDILRLKEEQQIAIQSTDDELTKWEKFRSDYTALQERLRTLPDKLSHPVMVPFGSKAFMPGHLVDTNEVLVLLGDNWFVDRSAKQACEIIDRRLVGITKQISDLKKQRDLLTPRVDFTAQLQEMADAQARGEMMEIQEEYDPVKEKKWREQHRKNVLQHRRQLKTEKKNYESVKPSEEKPKTDAELWARLDELERIESTRKELSRLTADDEKAQKDSAEGSQRTVRWADQQSDSDDDSEGSQEEITQSRPKSIRFKHSNIQENTASTSESPKSGEDPPKITSPADIYRVFASGQPTVRSILKPQSAATTTTSIEDSDTTTHPESVKKTSKVQAFSGSIVERDTCTVTSDKKPELPEADNRKKAPQKRVSKFKADRQKQLGENNAGR